MRASATISTATVLLAVTGCGEPLKPPTPEILQKVDASGGWWNGGCPSDNAIKEGIIASPEAVSLELTKRLTQQFPPGSNSSNLRQYLDRERFQALPPCESDPSIKQMVFSQNGGSMRSYPVFAVIAWKEDAHGNLVWAKGSAAYHAP
jgi:hypothetical protein